MILADLGKSFPSPTLILLTHLPSQHPSSQTQVCRPHFTQGGIREAQSLLVIFQVSADLPLLPEGSHSRSAVFLTGSTVGGQRLCEYACVCVYVWLLAMLFHGYWLCCSTRPHAPPWQELSQLIALCVQEGAYSVNVCRRNSWIVNAGICYPQRTCTESGVGF